VLYAEVPDLPGLLAAYPDTAAARMFADGEVRAAMGELLSSVEYDVDSILDQTAASAGLPGEMLHHPVQSLRAQLEKVTGASFSLSLNESEPGEFAETLLRMHAGIAGLQVLQDALYLYAVDHGGLFPATLAELGEELAAQDPWGRPYAYVQLPEGEGFELSCLGADGAPGGRGAQADLEVGSELTEPLGVEFERRLGLTVAASFVRPEDAAAAMALLKQAVSRSGLRPTEGPRPPEASDLDLTWYAVDAEDAGLPWMLRQGGLLAIGAGSSTPEGLLARRADPSGSALESDGYRTLEASFGGREGVTVSRFFLDLADVVRALEVLDPVEGVNWSLLAAAARSTWRSGLESGRFVTETLALPSGADSELTQCVAHDPVPENVWKFIPNDAIGMFATSVDAARLYAMILEVVQADFKADHVSRLSRLEERYEFNLADDVFGSLGTGTAGYLLPISGLMSLPGLALVAELDDPARFQNGLEGLLRLLEDEAGGDFQIKYRPYRDVPMWYFSFQGGPPIPISPSLVIVDGHLLVTLTSTRAKKEIKRILDLADPDSTAPELHPAHAMAPGESTFVGYMDWAQLFDGVYNGAKGALALMGGQLELPFDITALPEADLFTRFYEPSVVWTQVRDDAIYSRSESSFGPETLLGIGGLVGAGALGAQAFRSGQLELGETEIEVVEVDVEVESPEDPVDPPIAQREQTLDTMRFLATRLAVYKLEAGRYPDRLEQLVEATESYPRGFLDGRELPLDAWQGPLSYSVTADGSGYKLWSKGPDGLDQSGEGDDLVN